MSKQADPSEAECTGKSEGKDRESPPTGKDYTDSVALIIDDSVVGADRSKLDQKTKRKTNALPHTGKCEIPSVSENSGGIVYDEPKVQQVEFHVRIISKISTEALVAKGQIKSTKHNESISPNNPVFICQEGANVNIQPGCDPPSTEGVLKAVKSEGSHTLSLNDKSIICPDTLVPKEQRKSTNHNESTSSESPTCIDPEEVVIIPEGVVNFELGNSPTSTEGVVKAVKSKGSHTLSLDGNNITCPDTRFTEYSYGLRYADGTPKSTVFFYECCKYPGYYIRWYGCGQPTVNCEPCKSDKPHPFDAQWEEFQWHREPAKDINSRQTLQYSRLVACMPNPPNILSPYYLTFQNDQPAIHQNRDNAAIFLITSAN